jgi:hypothetical protein
VKSGQLFEVSSLLPFRNGNAFDRNHLLQCDIFFPIARRPDAAAKLVAILEKELPLQLSGDIDVLRQAAEMVSGPAQEAAAPAGCGFENAFRKEFSAARAIRLEKVEDKMVPRFVGLSRSPKETPRSISCVRVSPWSSSIQSRCGKIGSSG